MQNRCRGAHTQHVLRPGCPDDDLCPHGRHADLDARVAVLRQLACEELIQLGVEHTVCHELRLGTNASVPAAAGTAPPAASLHDKYHTRLPSCATRTHLTLLADGGSHVCKAPLAQPALRMRGQWQLRVESLQTPPALRRVRGSLGCLAPSTSVQQPLPHRLRSTLFSYGTYGKHAMQSTAQRLDISQHQGICCCCHCWTLVTLFLTRHRGL